MYCYYYDLKFEKLLLSFDNNQGCSEEIVDISTKTSCPSLLVVGVNKQIKKTKYTWLSTSLPTDDGVRAKRLNAA